jgi:uncharacterized membrane protein (UPF0127 family)
VKESAGTVLKGRRRLRWRHKERSGAGRPKLRRVVLIGPAGQIVCERCYVADRSLPRLRGLIGWPLAANEGMLLRPSAAIHTAFVPLPIDAVFLDRNLTVLAIVPNLKPWRIAWKRRAKSVLELSAGRCEQLGVGPGDTFAWGQL